MCHSGLFPPSVMGFLLSACFLGCRSRRCRLSSAPHVLTVFPRIPNAPVLSCSSRARSGEGASPRCSEFAPPLLRTSLFRRTSMVRPESSPSSRQRDQLTFANEAPLYHVSGFTRIQVPARTRPEGLQFLLLDGRLLRIPASTASILTTRRCHFVICNSI